jgi:hypothetical protein
MLGVIVATVVCCLLIQGIRQVRASNPANRIDPDLQVLLEQRELVEQIELREMLEQLELRDVLDQLESEVSVDTQSAEPGYLHRA